MQVAPRGRYGSRSDQERPENENTECGKPRGNRSGQVFPLVRSPQRRRSDHKWYDMENEKSEIHDDDWPIEMVLDGQAIGMITCALRRSFPFHIFAIIHEMRLKWNILLLNHSHKIR